MLSSEESFHWHSDDTVIGSDEDPSVGSRERSDVQRRQSGGYRRPSVLHRIVNEKSAVQCSGEDAIGDGEHGIGINDRMRRHIGKIRPLSTEIQFCLSGELLVV